MNREDMSTEKQWDPDHTRSKGPGEKPLISFVLKYSVLTQEFTSMHFAFILFVSFVMLGLNSRLKGK